MREFHEYEFHNLFYTVQVNSKYTILMDFQFWKFLPKSIFTLLYVSKTRESNCDVNMEFR